MMRVAYPPLAVAYSRMTIMAGPAETGSGSRAVALPRWVQARGSLRSSDYSPCLLDCNCLQPWATAILRRSVKTFSTSGTETTSPMILERCGMAALYGQSLEGTESPGSVPSLKARSMTALQMLSMPRLTITDMGLPPSRAFVLISLVPIYGPSDLLRAHGVSVLVAATIAKRRRLRFTSRCASSPLNGHHFP
jgi:hypothetical protein